jgi:hypothetical protein
MLPSTFACLACLAVCLISAKGAREEAGAGKATGKAGWGRQCYTVTWRAWRQVRQSTESVRACKNRHYDVYLSCRPGSFRTLAQGDRKRSARGTRYAHFPESPHFHFIWSAFNCCNINGSIDFFCKQNLFIAFYIRFRVLFRSNSLKTRGIRAKYSGAISI